MPGNFRSPALMKLLLLHLMEPLLSHYFSLKATDSPHGDTALPRSCCFLYPEAIAPRHRAMLPLPPLLRILPPRSCHFVTTSLPLPLSEHIASAPYLTVLFLSTLPASPTSAIRTWWSHCSLFLSLCRCLFLSPEAVAPAQFTMASLPRPSSVALPHEGVDPPTPALLHFGSRICRALSCRHPT
jgi:hypothetical protein